MGCVAGCVVLKKRPRWGLVGLQGERGAARATHPVEGDERVVMHGCVLDHLLVRGRVVRERALRGGTLLDGDQVAMEMLDLACRSVAAVLRKSGIGDGAGSQAQAGTSIECEHGVLYDGTTLGVRRVCVCVCACVCAWGRMGAWVRVSTALRRRTPARRWVCVRVHAGCVCGCECVHLRGGGVCV